MKVAIDISGQFGKMTGIQYYVDSLLTALFALDSSHDLTAFAPFLAYRQMLDECAKDGVFEWRKSSSCAVCSAGSDIVLQTYPFVRRHPLLKTIANHIDGRILNPYKSRTQARRIERASHSFDLVHIPEAWDLGFMKYWMKQCILTIYDVTTITRPEAHSPGAVEYWGKYFDFAKQRSARVLTISEFSKRDIVEHLGISADRVDVTPLAPRTSARRVEDADEVLAKFQLSSVPFVLYSGTLEPRKNLRRLVEAFALAVTEGRLPEHRLVLAGGHWHDHDQELRLWAEERSVGDRVILTGYVSNWEMNALMSSCEAFAYVSEYEGFGLPPLEAMVCGAPVVASDTTSLPEVVGDAGIQVAPTDTEAIAGALHRLLTDGAENRRRRVLSLERARLFSWERTARLTIQSYEAAVA